MYSNLYVTSFGVFSAGVLLYVYYSIKLSQDMRLKLIPVKVADDQKSRK